MICLVKRLALGAAFASFIYKPETPEKLKIMKTNICFKDVNPPQNGIYSPYNVLNGYSRPYGIPNVWSSDCREGAEWIEISFVQPKNLEEIHLIFNSSLELEHFSKPITGLVKEYDIYLSYEDGRSPCSVRFEARKRLPARSVASLSLAQ